MVKTDVSGWLADPGDVAGLVTGMRRALDGGRAIAWGAEARKRAIESFSMDSFIDRHIDFYQELIESHHGCSSVA